MQFSSPNRGLNPLISTLSDLLAAEGSPVELSFAYGASGLAFATYLFVADDNWGFTTDYPDVHWLWECLDRENYGVIESLCAHTERDLRRYDALNHASLWALAYGECNEGRQLIALRGGLQLDEAVAARLPARIVEAERDGATRTLVLEDADGSFTIEFVIALKTAKDSAPLVSVLTVRPATRPASAASRPRLLVDVLRWAVRHNDAKKELIHDVEVYFAAGVRALRAASTLVHTHRGDPDFDRYWAAYTGALAERRSHIGPFLRGIAETVALVPGVELAALQHASEQFDVIAAQWAAGVAQADEAEWSALIRSEEEAVATLRKAVGVTTGVGALFT